MYNLDDKDLDRISRNAAENYKAPGEPSWDALQKTLDIELPREKEKKRRGFLLFFLLAGLLVTGSLFWYGQHNRKSAISTKAITNNPVIDNKTESNTNTSAAPDKKKQAITSSNQNESEKTLPVNTVVLPKKQSASKNSSENLPNPENPNASILKKNNSLNKNDYHPEKNFNAPVNIRKQPKNNVAVNARRQPGFIATAFNDNSVAKNNRKNKTLIGKNKPVKSDKKSKPEIAGSDKNLTVDQKTTSAGTDSAKGSATVGNSIISSPPATNKAIADDSVGSTKKEISKAADKKNKVHKNNKAINIGLTAGLDLSTVKYTHTADPGFNIGLMGGYQFDKNWSVYTGLIYTKKNYNLDGKDYHPPTHYWTTYVDLKSVNGYCRMWEVPLLARYTFNSKSDRHFFISTGLSSYFMKKQQYNYSYKIINTGANANSAWTNDSSFNHIFSILHLSAGFEKQLGKHLNWQIEPYAKIPLGGVGFGDIKLSSFGINFSIQYRHAAR